MITTSAGSPRLRRLESLPGESRATGARRNEAVAAAALECRRELGNKPGKTRRRSSL